MKKEHKHQYVNLWYQQSVLIGLCRVREAPAQPTVSLTALLVSGQDVAAYGKKFIPGEL